MERSDKMSFSKMQIARTINKISCFRNSFGKAFENERIKSICKGCKHNEKCFAYSDYYLCVEAVFTSAFLQPIYSRAGVCNIFCGWALTGPYKKFSFSVHATNKKILTTRSFVYQTIKWNT